MSDQGADGHSRGEAAPGGDASTRLPPTLDKDEHPGRGGTGELEQSDSSAAYIPAEDADGGRAGRFWSVRRVPAAILALMVLGGAGLLLYDLAEVRAGGRAMEWRRGLADELASRPLDDLWIRVGAALAVAAGVWLIALAATPGLRALLPMRRTVPQVRPGLERGTAALVLRDRAMEVAGVRSVRVVVGRRRVRARALAHFRDLDVVRGDLDTALEDGIRQLGLARKFALSVRVHRPAKK